MILTFSENNGVAFEILSKARDVASKDELASIVFGSGGQDHIYHGADKVFSIGSEPNMDNVTGCLIQFVEEHQPEIVLIGGTRSGKEIAPRVAQHFGVGCATDCIDFSMEEGNLRIKRLVLGGRFIAIQNFLKKPGIATILPGQFEKKEDKTRRGDITETELELPEPFVQVLETKKKAPKEVRIEDADIIVSVGRGLKKKEDLGIIKEFADTLGATLGCSRSIAADLKWLPEEHWVGLSGHKVKPRLYIAVGVSGQVQHIAGIRDAGTIIAINNDPNAPIFKACDYGFVGDLYKIVPEITRILKKQA